MALLPPGTAGDGVADHGELAGRSAPNSHPVTAITGLADWQESQDRALAVGQSLRFIYVFSTTTTQEILLPTPSSTSSLAIVVVRTADGAMIEPGIIYLYETGPERYLEGVRLEFSPAVSGEYIVHIIR